MTIAFVFQQVDLFVQGYNTPVVNF